MLLTVGIFVVSNLKKTKNQIIISFKKDKGVPLLNFKAGPEIQLLNFEEGSGVPLLNFREIPGPTFKLSGRSRVPAPEVLLPLLHHTVTSLLRKLEDLLPF